MGDYIGDYYRVIKGDTRSLDYGSFGVFRGDCIEDMSRNARFGKKKVRW